MLQRLSDMRSHIEGGRTTDERVDGAFDAMRTLGFSGLIYDYSPVALDLDDRIITPSLMRVRNVRADMAEYWCDRGYYQIDPVQQIAVRTTTPFVWSYDRHVETPLARVLGKDHERVINFIYDSGMVCGATVPVHMPGGDFATVTGIRPVTGFEISDAEAVLPDFTLLAHVFHDAAAQTFDDAARTCAKVRLTPRERECLQHSAAGLSAKEISRRIGRSVPTVAMHLNSAARKLGARNRVQAVVRAAHYRLLG
jgi:LuxR family transcriptional regulator, quorum-sensing system regulator SdiA